MKLHQFYSRCVFYSGSTLNVANALYSAFAKQLFLAPTGYKGALYYNGYKESKLDEPRT